MSKSNSATDSDPILNTYLQGAPLFYAPEVHNFLRMLLPRMELEAGSPRTMQDKEFVGVLRNMRATFDTQIMRSESQVAKTRDEEEFGYLHPVTLIGKIIEPLGFSPEQNNVLTDVVRKSFPQDTVVDGYAKKSMPMVVGLAHLNSRLSEIPVTLVEYDIRALGATNRELGHEDTNRLMHTLTIQMNDHLRQRSKEVHAVRAGGDEGRMIIYGQDAPAVQKILDEDIHPFADLISAFYNVHRIPHTKAASGKLPGFGIAVAAHPLGKESPQEVRTAIGNRLETQKQMDALLHAGVITPENIEPFIKKVCIPFFEEHDIEGKSRETALNYIRAVAEENHAAANTYWQNITQQEGALYEPAYRRFIRENPGQENQPHKFFRHLAPTSREQRDHRLSGITLKPEILASERIPAYGQNALENYPLPIDPSELALRKVLKELGFTRLAEADPREGGKLCQWNISEHRYDLTLKLTPEEDTPQNRRLLRIACDLVLNVYRGRDPTSYCQSETFMKDDMEEFTRRHGGARAMVFEMKNLSGLNDASRYLGDAALGSTGEILQKALRANAGGMGDDIDGHVYHLGNGIFCAFVPPEYTDMNMNNVRNQVKADITSLGQHDVKKYFEDPNGRLASEQENARNMSFIDQKIAEQVREEAKNRGRGLAKNLTTLRKEWKQNIRTLQEIPSPKEIKGGVRQQGNFRFGITDYAAEITPGLPISSQLDAIMEEAGRRFEDAKKQTGQGRA